MSRWSSALVVWSMLAVYVASMAGSVVLGLANGDFQRDPGEGTSLRLAFTAFMAVGALIVARRPGNALGWVFAAIGLLAATGSLAMTYAEYAYLTRPGALPARIVAAWYASWFWFPLIALILLYALLLFPTGRVPSPRWRWLAWAAGVAAATITVLTAVQPTLHLQDVDDFAISNPIGVPGLGNPETSAVGQVLFVLFLACIIAAALSLIVRFRRARDEERQQLKWFAYAGALVALSVLLEEVLALVLPDFMFGLLIALMPVSVGVAVLRYRLYEIDRIVNRTLAYALITAVLGGLYVLGVLLLGQLFAPLAPDSQLAVAGSTLAVAAAFGPVRRRVQALVDRRFNRTRYDAVRTVAEFRGRLRNEVDLDHLSTDLLAVVGSTVEPARVSLWLRPARIGR